MDWPFDFVLFLGRLSSVWILFSGIVCGAWRALPEGAKETLVRDYPRADAAVRFVRKIGFDWVPALLELVRVVTGKRIP